MEVVAGVGGPTRSDVSDRARKWVYRLPLTVAVVAAMLLSGFGTIVSVVGPDPTSPRAHPATPSFVDAPAKAAPGTFSHPGCPVASCGPASVHTVPTPTSSNLGSTPTNWYVANWSGEGMIRENPNDPRNLVSGGLYMAPSAANDTATYFSSGVSGAFTSRDGGRTWTDQVLPPSPDWTDASSAECGHFHLADTAIGFGPGNLVYYIDLSYPSGSSTSCPNPTAGIGLYSTVSHDGGGTWNTPVPMRGTTPGTSVDKPWIAVDQSTGEAYVAFTDDGNGTGIWLQNSTDQGASWTDPIELTASGNSGLGVELVVDPWGGVDVSWINEGTAAIEFVRSADHGATFSSPVTIAVAPTTYSSSSPDSFRSFTLPGFGVDGYPGNAFTGTLFSVWQNGLGGSAGDPTTMLSRSTDNGSTWSAPISVSSKVTDQDYQPSVAVGSDGAVYVDWYGVNSINGSYRLEAALSTDGGQTFFPEVSVSDVDSNPSTATTGPDWWIGDYTDIVGDASGARPLWTDARATEGWYCTGACLWGYTYNISFYTALLVNDSISASIPVNLSLNGTVGGVGLEAVGPVPSPSLWLAGASYNISAPSTASWNGSAYYFDYWYGGPGGRWMFSNSTSVSGTVAGGEDMVACYSLQPGGTCQAPGAPGFLGITLVPASANLTVDGVVPAPGQFASPFPEVPGIHWVNATAPGYYSLNVSVLVSPGNTTFETLTLLAIAGTIAGSVSPTTASVTINGTPVVVLVDGSFSVSLLPGTYTVVAAAPRYYSYSNTSVPVSSSETTLLPIVLEGLPGWINGSVAPASLAVVTVNGASVPVNPTTGAFSVRVAPGTYWVNASALGYLPDGSGPRTLGPLGEIIVYLSLTEILGTISGLVVPVTASVTVNGTAVTTTNGMFQVDLPPAEYPVTASASGYDPLALSVVVHFAEFTVVVLTLNVSVGWIAGTVGPAGTALAIDGQPVTLGSGGSFNVSARPGTHQLHASADGYVTADQNLSVNAGRTTHASVTLDAVSPASEGPTYLIPALLLVAVVVAGLIGVLVWRRRRHRPPR